MPLAAGPTLMRASNPAWVQVKAAGGVRTIERLMELKVRAIGVGRVSGTATKAKLGRESPRSAVWPDTRDTRGTRDQ